MNTEESYEKERWYVLKKLKACFLRSPKNEPTEYTVLITDPRIQSDKPSPDNETKMIRQLIDDKIINEVQPSLERKGRVGEYIPYPRYIYFLEPTKRFEKVYTKYQKISGEKIKPRCKTINGIGYLQFKKGKEITLIGGEKLQPFRLLSFLMDPVFGVGKTIASTFNFITEYTPRKKSNLDDPYLKKNTVTNVIKNTFKELQKNKKMKYEKMEIKIKLDNQKVWLEYKDTSTKG